ncbi:PAS domain-containing protein [Rhizobium halophilum]|uniref:PAS domain-containing protein n=1 Tax=Rhizobium halophilum TaxID=2846852 RepID=UPI001EFCC06D|nr:PAS domain-containing protein [Rhizobium halophilum]MCF6371246.1 PAS domain-containing protein [Rhizobium halophilum]
MSEMSSLIRVHDWSNSALGAVDCWPTSLRLYSDLMLASKQPMFLAWGSELAFLYNDAYTEILGKKHPHALGQPFYQVWSDIWRQIRPLVERVLEGEAVWVEDLCIPMQRNGFEEQAWFSFSYTPIKGDAGEVMGLFCAVTETTGKVLAEQQGRGERERLRQLFQQAPGIMAMLRGPKHIFELANEAYTRLIGQRDIIGKTVRDALPELAGQGFYELLDEVFRTGTPYVGRAVPVQLNLAHSNEPEQLYLNFIYQPVKDKAGLVTGIFVEGFDVTENVRTEEALRSSEEFTRRILESSTDCIKVLDTKAQLQFMSEGGMKVMEVDDFGAIKSCDWRDFWSGPQHLDAKLAVETALAGGTARFQGPTPTMKGTPRWWDVVVTPIHGRYGEVERLLSVSRDITSIKQSEVALHETQRRLNAVLDNASVSVFLMNDQQECVYMNAAAEKLTGFSLAEAEGRTLHSLIHHTRPDGSPYPIEDCPIDRAFPERHQTTGEDIFIRKDGTFYPVAFTASPIQDAESKTVGTIIEVRDISAEKRSQQQQRILIDELNHRVKNTLATVQSIVTQSLRNEADRAKARSSIEGRLIMLSRAHDVLTKETWESARLHDIIDEATSAFQAAGTRITADGPEIRLTPRQALSLSMALHELATNALTHGALSLDNGTVSLVWELLSDRGRPLWLRLKWQEKNGPPVSKPSRRGFGSRLLEVGLARELNGDVTVNYAVDGLTCDIAFQLQDHSCAAAPNDGPTASTRGHSSRCSPTKSADC